MQIIWILTQLEYEKQKEENFSFWILLMSFNFICCSKSQLHSSDDYIYVLFIFAEA